MPDLAALKAEALATLEHAFYSVGKAADCYGLWDETKLVQRRNSPGRVLRHVLIWRNPTIVNRGWRDPDSEDCELIEVANARDFDVVALAVYHRITELRARQKSFPFRQPLERSA